MLVVAAAVLVVAVAVVAAAAAAAVVEAGSVMVSFHSFGLLDFIMVYLQY